MGWRSHAFFMPLAVLASIAQQVLAQEPITSPAPERVAVTIYRDPDRNSEAEMDLDWLEGYALVTETRTVDIPAGRSVLRFEGVAAGMLPESAIVTGLPAGVREKNLDADLLSPRSLYARSFGRPVILRRQNKKTGAISEERAIVRSGADGSVIVQTRDGFEAANCGPLNDSLVYEGVPGGLSARPTLSVETEASAPGRATLSLSYLAWGFDWQANYIFRIKRDGRHANVLAWVTLASSDATSFADAETSVVGGKVNREDSMSYSSGDGTALEFHCFFRPLAPPPVEMAAYAFDDAGEIVVTALRRQEILQSAPVAVTVIEEGLGDLKLYRVPIPTTVAARAQKQVAMFELPDVKFNVVYTNTIWNTDIENVAAIRHLRLRNRKEDGLGRALPAGRVVAFEALDGRPILSGEGTLQDAAVGEKVDVELGEATQVFVTAEEIDESSKDDSNDIWTDVQVTVTNANPWPIAYEARIAGNDGRSIEQASKRLQREAGYNLWKVTVPASGSARLRYRVRMTSEEGPRRDRPYD